MKRERERERLCERKRERETGREVCMYAIFRYISNCYLNIAKLPPHRLCLFTEFFPETLWECLLHEASGQLKETAVRRKGRDPASKTGEKIERESSAEKKRGERPKGG